jgi:hypothetical protein
MTVVGHHQGSREDITSGLSLAGARGLRPVLLVPLPLFPPPPSPGAEVVGLDGHSGGTHGDPVGVVDGVVGEVVGLVVGSLVGALDVGADEVWWLEGGAGGGVYGE